MTAFSPRGVDGAIEDTLFPVIRGICWCTGTTALQSLTFLGVDAPDRVGVDAVGREMLHVLTNIAHRRASPDRDMASDYDRARVLLPHHAHARERLIVRPSPASRADRSP